MGDTAEPLLTDRYGAALAWANELHRTQVRKGTAIPYVSHVISVSALVLEAGGSEDQAIAAALHDSVEDCDVTEAQLVERFGDDVAALVLACSDGQDPERARDDIPWIERKRAYIAHLGEARGDALLVSVADKVHNSRAIAADVERDGEATLERFTAKADGTRWYYRRLADAFGRRPADVPASLLLELERAILRFGATEEAATAYEASR